MWDALGKGGVFVDSAQALKKKKKKKLVKVFSRVFIVRQADLK